MKLPRLAPDSSALTDFYEEALAARGAVCERPWHDRLRVLAEGASARLWNDDGALHEVELWFPPADDTAPRDAAREVFPGCPLTFRLAEALRPSPLVLERALLTDETGGPPDAGVAERLWLGQFPRSTRWRLEQPFSLAHHVSLVALARCEVQAIDQHWSLHRLALALCDGARDEHLSESLSFAQLVPEGSHGQIAWPPSNPARWQGLVRDALAVELEEDLAPIRVRQQNYLRRELERIQDYFANYERELSERAARSHSENTRTKLADRLAATRAEHARRRAEQIARHEIRVIPHLDVLLLLAERAWQAEVSFVQDHGTHRARALFIPRSREWKRLGD